MKRLSYLLVIIALCVGCAAVKQASVDFKDCMADPACRAEAVADANNAKSIAQDVAPVIPVPAAGKIAGSAAFGLALIISAVRRRRKSRQ